MVLFFCAFLALRSEDAKVPMGKITDFELHKENELFAGSVSTRTRPIDHRLTLTEQTHRRRPLRARPPAVSRTGNRGRQITSVGPVRRT